MQEFLIKILLEERIDEMRDHDQGKNVSEYSELSIMQVSPWLLEAHPWVAYRTRVDLLGQAETDPEVQAARLGMLADPAIQQELQTLTDWPGAPLKSHKTASHNLHRLVFLTDLGIRSDDAGMDRILARVADHQSVEGPYQVLMNIHPRYGGTGENQWVWMLCDAPSILYALLRVGQQDRQGLIDIVAGLVDMGGENGWPCRVTTELGKFRGPGRKGDPCPYATLLMLKLMAQIPEFQSHPNAQYGCEVLLNLWTQRRERKPYLFAMGSGFEKLKAPLIWYDLLHVTDVLTRFSATHADPRLLEMLDILWAKVDPDGRFMPESIWMAWKEWDFGQKRVPSPWITFLSHRILARVAVTQR